MNHASEFPELMRKLPIDRRRNVPIPAVTAHHPDGEPDFSTVDGREAFRLASEGRCGICAQPFADEVAFLGGPGAAAVGAYHDPPMHEGCAEASTRLCPHLARRDMRRLTDRRSTGELPAGSSPEKPDVWVMWICQGFSGAVVNAMPVFLPEAYTRLRIFTYTADGQLHESFDTTPGVGG
ncbi:hypothetical protein CcI49_32825 [Frankia sp. CcI49]|uniref:hypothetical protein n=1 Tax=Frankia sp. CcI49 TaxID=1745382 RepID=UPI00097605F8|nr:hypothetical protein [Frankia sp. CcI49]ONH52917.1 hypothetical protein CcI49_32825 [Frankia sp. CcI49]